MLVPFFRRLRAGWSTAREPLELVLYTRPDCPLCEAMKAEIARARVRLRYRLREVDISGDAELEARHGRSIPVLEIGGRAAFKGRLEADDFARKLARRADEIRKADASPRADAARESEHA